MYSLTRLGGYRESIRDELLGNPCSRCIRIDYKVRASQLAFKYTGD